MCTLVIWSVWWWHGCMCDCGFQHSTSIHVQSKFSCEMLDFWGWESFGEDISDHVIGGTEYKLDFAIIKTTQWMKWKWMSICFVHMWYWWFLVSTMANWFSENKVIGSSRGIRTSPINKCSHSASFVACVMAMYLLSVVNRERISCFFKAQDMTLPSIKNVYSKMAFWSLAMLPSTSIYPCSSLLIHLHIKHRFFVSITYCRIIALPHNEPIWGCLRSMRQWTLHTKCLDVCQVWHI